MNDVLLSLSKNAGARSLVTRLGLPVPMPEPLRRARDAWSVRELDGLAALVLGAGDAPLRAAAREALAAIGANLPDADAPLERVHALVLDATQLARVEELGQLYEALAPRVGQLARSGRVVVIGRPASEAKSAETAAVRAALEGFTRSLAKEIGRKGATANLLVVAQGAEDRIAMPLRFLASPRSAFVTAQPLVVSGVASGAADARVARALDGKVALVTGAARGIGAATARQLAAEGAHVVCLDRPEDEDEALRVVREIGGSALLTDLSDPAAPGRIEAGIRDAHGGLDIVVHNAGITRDRTLAKMSRRLWDQAIDVNLGAVVHVTDRLAEKLLRPGGRVVVLSSVAGIAGNVGQTNYAASKAGVAAWARALAPLLATRGVTVNAVAPGFIETRLTAAIPLMIREGGRRLSALGQGGLPEDVAAAITFLALPGAQGVTGQVLRVCGGALIGA